MISFRDFLLELKEKLKRLLFYNLPITYSEDSDEKKEIFVPFQLKKEKKFPNNYIEHPYNIYLPDEIVVDNAKYNLYLARFNNIYELYEYLKSNPRINDIVFSELASEKENSNFAGKPYEEALEDLILEDDPGYEEFLMIQKDLNNARKELIHKYQTVKTVAGGHLNVPAYSAGNPLCYETEERIVKPKFVRIHISLSYYWGTTKNQVLHRAIIITNVLKALEKAGYSVDLNAFELSEDADELIYIVVQLKKYGEKLNMSALYKSLCHVEFLRRILFRVLETMDVKNDWMHGYGSTCNETFTRKVLNFGKNDIFFDRPRNMGICGSDLAEDFENAIRHLKLEDKIDVEKAKKEFSEQVKILEKKK